MSDSFEICEYLENLTARGVGEKTIRDGFSMWKRQIRKSANPGKRKKIPKGWIFAAHKRQGGLCARCGQVMNRSTATGDHTIPHNRGGEHAAENISAMHRDCNSAKSDNMPEVEAKKTGRTILEQLKAAAGEVD